MWFVFRYKHSAVATEEGVLLVGGDDGRGSSLSTTEIAGGKEGFSLTDGFE